MLELEFEINWSQAKTAKVIVCDRINCLPKGMREGTNFQTWLLGDSVFISNAVSLVFGGNLNHSKKIFGICTCDKQCSGNWRYLE